MNARLKAATLLAASLSAFYGCGERLAGGTIETTNGISARVVLPNGRPAANIKMFLLDEQNWLVKTKAGESLVLDSAETDSEGNFRIDSLDTNHTVSLVADVEDYGVLIHDVDSTRLKNEYDNVIGLRKKVSYEGTVKDTTYEAKKIFLAGSPYSADVDSATGKFIIRDVPQEQYSVVILRKLPDASLEYVVSDKIKLDEWTTGQPAVIIPDTSKSFLIEDFEDSDNRNLLVLGGGWWTALNDYPGGNSTILQPANAAPQNWVTAIKAGRGNASRTFQVLYALGTNQPSVFDKEPHVLLENSLGGQNVHYNFSGMDSLTFWSGGNGRVQVELVQENPIESGVEISVIASKTFDLTNAWERYTIKPSDLTVQVDVFPSDPESRKAEFDQARLPAYTKKPETWKEMGGMITQLRFKGKGGNEFWLDDIRVHGITAGDLVK
ncbi:MAG: hypothetical protein JWO30_1876 [Fibrobacteres bacterium]|nr:hypothetical protein [Fibrobacterota bacterium]